MIETDSRGVQYDFSKVGSAKWNHIFPQPCWIIERVGPRPVDVKREARRMRREEKISAGVNLRMPWPK